MNHEEPMTELIMQIPYHNDAILAYWYDDSNYYD